MIKKWAFVFLISSLLAGLGFAQQHQPGQHSPQQHQPGHEASAAPGEHQAESHAESGDPFLMWKWINFGLLAAGLGYLISKNLPPFFASRTEEIQKGIAESAQLKASADARFAEMEARMSKLGAEIEALRAQGKAEMAAEGARLRQETEATLAKLQANAEAEIESSTKAARQELKAYAAQLAVEIASQRIRARAGSGEAGLVDKFIRNLERKGANN